MYLKKFLKEEHGDAYVWLMIIIGLALFGLFYGLIDPFMKQMLAEGVTSGIPAEQQGIEANVWNYLPVAVLFAFGFWGYTQSQRRRQAF